MESPETEDPSLRSRAGPEPSQGQSEAAPAAARARGLSLRFSQGGLFRCARGRLFAWWLRPQGLPRPVLYGGGLALILIFVAMGIVPFVMGVDQDDLEGLGYAGVFVANFLGTATVFIPVPGLTAAGQALIVATAQTLNPVAVAFAGSAGMTLAESTAYLTGFLGRELSEQRSQPLRGRLGRTLRRAAGFVDRLMLRYGFVTLLVLAAVPNPVFEFAGITAGAVRMNFWRFLLAVAIGKTIRALTLAFVG
ncbi:MAG: VTT domain-containing protein, partial [Chloroflexota bacterium]|nr:VTT domain-containing protein [Chloroflexota bacterium]